MRPAAERDPQALRLRVFDDPGDLGRLAPLWDPTEAASETRSPFLSFAWASAWWDELGAGQELRALLVEDGEGPAAIAPLCLCRRRLGVLGYRSLEILGTGRLPYLGMGLADRADLLLARRRRAAARRIFEHLLDAAAGWDVIDLRFVPAGSTTLDALREVASERGAPWELLPCAISPYVRLGPAGGDGWGDTRRGRPRWLRRALRKLARRGEVKLELGFTPDHDAAAALGEAEAVSRASWKGARGTALLTHPRAGALLRRVAGGGGMNVSLLRVGGEAVAYELCFVHAGRALSYDSAYQRELAADSPGSVLTALILEHLRGAGFEEYDLLRGDEPHKRRWHPRFRHEVQALLFNPTSSARKPLRAGFRGVNRWRRTPWLVAAQNRAVGLLRRWVER